MIWPAETYFVHGVEPITKSVRWSVNSFLGREECVAEYNRNTYGPNFWYHEATRPYNDTLEKAHKEAKVHGPKRATY